MKTSPNQSLSKALGFGSMSVMTTRTTSLGDQMANLMSHVGKHPARRPLSWRWRFFSLLLELILLGVAT